MIRFIATLCLLLLPGAVVAQCAENHLDLRGEFGTARFSVEIADDAPERAQGLMHRDSMPRNAGMLFVYDRPQSVSFWMRNTLIPLDMLFADETGTVKRIHQNAIPLDLTSIPGGEDIQFVLEINGGLAELLGIEEGSVIRHPSIGEAAIWSCTEE